MISKPFQPLKSGSRIRVLVVDDSPASREFLIQILNRDPDIEVVGVAGSGEEALRAVSIHQPDLVTMDIRMPGMDGIKTTRTLMETHPVPIVIVTDSYDKQNKELSFKAIQAGALAVLTNPGSVGQYRYAQAAENLISTVKSMSEIKVVRRWKQERWEKQQVRAASKITPRAKSVRIVVIGASTGGPPVIEHMLAHLPVDFSPPILIIQHMAAGFIDSFVDCLNRKSSLPVHIASHGITPQSGHVYVAPDGRQMKVNAVGNICLKEDLPMYGFRPSVSYLFRSVAENYGGHAMGILLTGMGKDGAAELKLMREKGAVTIVQDRATSIVFGMAGEAIKLGAAEYIQPAERIPSLMANIIMPKKIRNEEI